MSKEPNLSASTNSSRSTSIEPGPTAVNLVSLLKDTPVLVIRRDESGRYGSEDVYEQMKSLSGDGFEVYGDAEAFVVVKGGHSRSFRI